MTPSPHRLVAEAIERELEWSRLQGEWVDGNFERDHGEDEPSRVPTFSDGHFVHEWFPWWIVCESCGWERDFTTEDAMQDARASHDCASWLRERRAELARIWPTLDADMDGAA